MTPRVWNLVGLSSSSIGLAHAQLAAEALRDVAGRRGRTIRVEIQSAGGTLDALTPDEIAAADLVLIAADRPVTDERFAGKTIRTFTLAEAIRHTASVLAECLNDSPAEISPRAEPASRMEGPKLVAVTSCPTGIAHTFMAAEGLKKAAKRLGYEMRVETQGAVGAGSVLTPGEIAEAAVVIVAADTKVDLARFTGKRIHTASTNDAIRHPAALIESALAPEKETAPASQQGRRRQPSPAPARSGPYKHLMTGVSHMLPVVVAGGLAIALAFAFGGIYAAKATGTFGAALNQIGVAAFGLIIPLLSGYIAFSIADRPGLAPGLIGGVLAQQFGAGFLGGLASGFIAGYLTGFLNRTIKLPQKLQGLKPVLILPLLASLGVGLLMVYLIAPPMHHLLTAAADWLDRLRGTNAIVLGLILGAMMAFDMGGPVNKAAYTFALGLLATQVTTPIAAVMAAGMTPPLGVSLAVLLFPRRFAAEEREASGAAFVLGLAFITEGAIPFAAKDPVRVIPALILGSAAAGAWSMVGRIQLLVPHGGVFAALIPGAVNHLFAYFGAIAIGTVVTALTLGLLKRTQPAG